LFEKKSEVASDQLDIGGEVERVNTSGNANRRKQSEPPDNHSISQKAHRQVSALTANPDEKYEF
jgi:hypothetical protein